MKIRNFLLPSVTVCIITLICNGCRHEKQSLEYAMDFEAIDTHHIIGIPLDVVIDGESMLVNQFSGDKYLTWFSLSNGNVLQAKIAKGNGPNEMQGPLMVSSFSDSLLIFDRSRFRLYKSDLQCDSIITYIENLPFWTTKIFPMSNGCVIASKIPFGVVDENISATRFAVIRGDSVLSNFGKYPNLSKSDRASDSEQLANFHQIHGFTELPGNRFAVTSSHVLSLYSGNGNEYHLEKEFAIAPYEYESQSSTSNHSANTTLLNGYSYGTRHGLEYYDGKIYLPFREAKDDNMIFLVYDMDLNLIGKIVPSIAIDTPFTIDEKGRIVTLREGENGTEICVSENSLS